MLGGLHHYHMLPLLAGFNCRGNPASKYQQNSHIVFN